MLTKKIAILSGVLTVIILVIAGCSKTNTVVVDPGSAITQTMSFANDIQPILTASCAKSGCHIPGAKVPNLTNGSSFQALTVGGYVKANDPDNSNLMLWLNGKKSPVMPLGAGPDININAKISAWIKQGAKNN